MATVVESQSLHMHLVAVPCKSETMRQPAKVSSLHRSSICESHFEGKPHAQRSYAGRRVAR